MAKLSNINGRFAVEDDGAIQFNGQAGTDGYVLESRGDSAPPVWTDRDTGRITGSGLANRVTYWTGTYSISSDDDFRFNGTNVSIGVAPASSRRLLIKGLGTDATTASFQVNDGNNVDVFLIKDDKSASFTGLVSGITPTAAANFTTKAYVDALDPKGGPYLPLAGGTMNSGAAIGFVVADAGGNFINITHTNNEAWSIGAQSGTGVDDYLDIGIDGGTRAMSWHETGNVGIGTSSPDVSGAGSSSTVLSVIETVGNRRGILELGDNQNADTGGIGSINFVGTYQDAGHKVMAEIRASGSGATSGKRGSSISMYTKANGTATIQEALRIDSSQNVRTYAKLGIRVDGDAIPWRGVAQIPAVINLAGNGALFTRPDYTYLGQNFYYNASDTGAVIDAGKASLIELSAGDIKFYGSTAGTVASPTISLQERMRIDSDGRIMINQSSNITGQALQVNGFIDITKSTSNAIRFFDNTTFRGGLGLDSWASGGSASNITMFCEGEFGIVTGGGSTKKLVMDTSGNVGIGTNSPTAKLSVVGTKNGVGIRIAGEPSTGSAYYYGIMHDGTNLRGTTQTNLLFTEGSVLANTTIAEWASLRIANPSTAATGAVITNNYAIHQGSTVQKNYFAGSVGIGEDAPGTLLSLKSPLANTSIITLKCSKNDSSWTVGDRIGGINFFGEDGSGQGAGIKGSINYIVSSSSGGSNAMTFNVAGTSNNMERIRIDNVGNVGIGTTTMNQFVNITSGSNTTTLIQLRTADDSEIMNFGIGSDVGYLFMESNTDMTFGTNGGEKMRIASGGNVGIGTGSNTPSARLHVVGTGTNAQFETTASYSDILFKNSTHSNFVNFSGATFLVYQGGGSGSNVTMSVDSGGTAKFKADVVAYGSPSDKRLKENIKPIDSALEKVIKLQGVTFDWKEKAKDLDKEGNPIDLRQWKHDIGFIAQDVQKVIPELIRENDNGMLSMRHQGIAPILLEAIKELKAEIEELKSNKCNCNK